MKQYFIYLATAGTDFTIFHSSQQNLAITIVLILFCVGAIHQRKFHPSFSLQWKLSSKDQF